MAAPTWTEVRVDMPVGWHELVAEVLASGPCTSVSIDSPSIGQAPPKPGCEVLCTYLPSTDDAPESRARILAHLARLGDQVEELGGLEAHFTPLPPEDHATSGKKVWRAFRLGRRLVVAPPWWEGEVAAHELLLELEPGGAFGSGWFVFSGCPARDHGATLAAIEAAGLRVERQPRSGPWCTFIGRQRGAEAGSGPE